MNVRLTRRVFLLILLISVSVSPAACEAHQSPDNNSLPTDCTNFLPYSPQRDHIWNQVHRRLFERFTNGGKILGCDEVDPLLWPATEHILVDPAYHETLKLLDEFINSHSEKLVRDPLKRAIFQHDLWSVFDWLADTSYPDDRQKSDQHLAHREQLESRLALIIKSVALTRAEITRLPDNLNQLRQVRHSHDFPELPNTAAGSEGSWELFGLESRLPVAPMHANIVSPRSAFFVYLKLPVPSSTADYVEQLKTYSRTRPTKEDCYKRPCKPPQFPAGTQVALVRRAMLIDVDGNPVISPITESIQLRKYLAVPAIPRGFLHTSQHFPIPNSQLFAEFRCRRALLLRGDQSLHQLGPSETAFEPRGNLPNVGDYIEKYGDTRHTPLQFCAGCHMGPGVTSFMSYVQIFEGDKFRAPRFTTEAGEQEIAIQHLISLTAWKLLDNFMKLPRS
jgi:hypothetical protein